MREGREFELPTLPGDVKELNLKIEDLENINLLFNKFLWQWEYKKGKEAKWEIQKERWEDFERVAKQLIKTALIQFRQKQQKFIDLLKKDYSVKILKAEVAFRLNVGLGTAHVAETSMLLHHIYGVPYIPGSSVKGVTRFAALVDLYESYKGKSNKTIDLNKLKELDKKLTEGKYEKNTLEETIVKIFGSKVQKGAVEFLDAYPERAEFKLDVINVHYRRYYEENKEPVDWDNPVPVPFITVENATFYFPIILTEELNEEYEEKLKNWINKALTDYGLGAKTSIGYGIFNKLNWLEE